VGRSDLEVDKPKLGRNIVALSATSFLTDVSGEMIYPLVPLFLSSVLGASASAVGAIEGAAESVAALLKLASGWISDRVKRRKPLVVFGYGLAGLVRPFIGLAQSVPQVAAIRITDRVGKGIRTSPRDALIADSVTPAIRGRAYGFHSAADNAGAVLGPLVAFAMLKWWE
jgi:MFS family permease